jgi:ubiquitin C-terminal hydrolase
MAQEAEKLFQSRCPACMKDLRTKQLVVETWPHGLIVHVKRFNWDGRSSKDQRGIGFEPSMQNSC